MEQIEGKNYLTIAEIMERLKVCRQTVLKYKKDKKLDFIMLRGKVYITEESYNNMFIPESKKHALNQIGLYDKKQVEEIVRNIQRIAQNIAIARAMKSNLDKSVPQNSWVTTIHSNCYDLAIIGWCKIFSPNAEHLYFKNTMPNDKDKKFESELYEFLKIDKDTYKSYVEELKTYRDKLIVHADKDCHLYITRHPSLDIALRSTFFYHKYFFSYYKKDHDSEAGIKFFGHGTNNLEDYYNKYNKQVSKIINIATESAKDINDLCL